MEEKVEKGSWRQWLTDSNEIEKRRSNVFWKMGGCLSMLIKFQLSKMSKF